MCLYILYVDMIHIKEKKKKLTGNFSSERGSSLLVVQALYEMKGERRKLFLQTHTTSWLPKESFLPLYHLFELILIVNSIKVRHT